MNLNRFLASAALAAVIGMHAVMGFGALAPHAFAQEKTDPKAGDTAPTTPATTDGSTKTPTTNTAAADPAAPSVSAPTGFVPLTTIPGIADAARSPDLPAFLNNLYKICIGAAAVLAVLQIVRGGITYMLGDSVTEKREARHHISLAIFGLILVLSPAIVFGVIDPKILDLNVNVNQLTPGGLNSAHNGTLEGTQTAADSCAQNGGHLVFEASGAVRCDAPNSDQPGAGTQTSENGTTLNYRDLPTAAGHAILVLIKFDESQQPACMMLAYKSFADQAACNQETPAIRASHSGWGLTTNCETTPGATYRMQSSRPICSAVEAIP